MQADKAVTKAIAEDALPAPTEPPWKPPTTDLGNRRAGAGAEPPWRRLARLEAELRQAQAAEEAKRPRVRARSEQQAMQRRFSSIEGHVEHMLDSFSAMEVRERKKEAIVLVQFRARQMAARRAVKVLAATLCIQTHARRRIARLFRAKLKAAVMVQMIARNARAARAVAALVVRMRAAVASSMDRIVDATYNEVMAHAQADAAAEAAEAAVTAAAAVGKATASANKAEAAAKEVEAKQARFEQEAIDGATVKDRKLAKEEAEGVSKKAKMARRKADAMKNKAGKRAKEAAAARKLATKSAACAKSAAALAATDNARIGAPAPPKPPTPASGQPGSAGAWPVHAEALRVGFDAALVKLLQPLYPAGDARTAPLTAFLREYELLTLAALGRKLVEMGAAQGPMGAAQALQASQSRLRGIVCRLH